MASGRINWRFRNLRGILSGAGTQIRPGETFLRGTAGRRLGGFCAGLLLLTVILPHFSGAAAASGAEGPEGGAAASENNCIWMEEDASGAPVVEGSFTFTSPPMNAVGDVQMNLTGKPSVVEAGETFTLSWNADFANWAVLYRREGSGSWEELGFVPISSSGYEQTITDPGEYEYTIMAQAYGEAWQQSEIAHVRVEAADPGNMTDTPILYCSRETVEPDEPFYLLWNEKNADRAALYRMTDGGEWESLGAVDLMSRGYEQKISRVGQAAYQLRTQKDGEDWKESHSVHVTVAVGTADSENSGKPVLHASKTEVMSGETFHLSWNADDAARVTMYRRIGAGDWEAMGSVPKSSCGYPQSLVDVGSYSYVLMVMNSAGNWTESTEVTVAVTADMGTVCSQLQAKGYDNVWNLLFMIYRNVRIGGYTGAFTDAQIIDVTRQAGQVREYVNSLSGGLWKIGTVDVVVVDEPVTSATKVGSYILPGLSYGPGKDVDFNYILDHKDIQLVAVYAPLRRLISNPDWLGLGGGKLTTDSGREVYNIIVNDIYTDHKFFKVDGASYRTAVSTLIHEMIHAVETNSRHNGWIRFEELHDFSENGYVNTRENGNYPWYQDLLRDTLKNGNRGFLPYSYYVTHAAIPKETGNGFHSDYDGKERLYINGIPQQVDLRVPEGTAEIGEEAFGTNGAQYVYVPESVRQIGAGAFGAGTTVIGRAGSAAETWARENGCAFIAVP